MAEKHTCTDPCCGLIFIAFLCYGGYIMSYAFQNGDPRKVYHGMDYEGRLCGVDLPYKPYVYWCKTDASTNPLGGSPSGLVSVQPGSSAWAQPTNLDFEHPICVEYCPQFGSTQNQCYDPATGGKKPTPDYATHPVAKKYCFPQAKEMMDKINSKMAGHPLQKYLPQVIATVRTNWQVLLGAFFLAFILSSIYLLLIECMAGLVIWACIIVMIVIPGCSGGYLIYASEHGGIDGMPGSGDAQTDLYFGIGCCVTSAFFLLMACCMRNAIAKAISVVEAAATCLFECKSLLLEPIINLTTRMALWALMLTGLAWLISVGEVRKSKIYRTFTYTDEEWIYIGSYIFLILWVNDFCTAMSQYVIANASARWYFTDHNGGMKLGNSCLLCRGYLTGWIYHFGSLALGSCIIAIMRPIRICVLAIVMAEELVDNAACGCISKCCFCCVECFNSFLVHLSKNAYIDMAITSKGFCAAGSNAAELMVKQSKTLIASAGATWIFTLLGLAKVTTLGAFITSLVVQNVEAFNRPTSRHYVQDPMVCAGVAGVVCFFVALCFMIVFDAVTDTMVLCLAYDREEAKTNPVPMQRQQMEERPQSTGMCGAWFGTTSIADIKKMKVVEARRPQYTPAKMQNW